MELSVGYRTPAPHTTQLQAECPIKLLHQPVTLASTLFKFLPVEDPHRARRISDCFLLLENAGSQTHARPVRSQHSRQEIMGDAKQALIHSVLHDQQPTGKPLLN